MHHRSNFVTSCVLLLTVLAVSCRQTAEPTLYAPGDPAIHIMGRVMHNDEGNVEFDWPGVTISAHFAGSYCALRMDDTGENFYNVFLDDAPVRIITVRSDTTIVLAEELSKGTHRLLVTKRTEGFLGKATFKGLLLDGEEALLPLPAAGDKKIEFIGNSITCGYGTESNDKTEEFKSGTENNYYSYAPVTARAFGAEYHIVAHSGQGVVRNYGYEQPVSPYTMTDRYLQVFDEQQTPRWDFSSWIPDLVVINLGTNDFSTTPHPEQAVFTQGYNELIQTVRQHYGAVPVFCIVGPMMDEPCYTYVKNMVDVNRSLLGDGNIYFVGIPTYLMVPDEDLGAGFHPNYAGQIKMAEHVVPVIASVMGWDYGEIR